MGTAITKRFDPACPVQGNLKVFRVPNVPCTTTVKDMRVPIPWDGLLLGVDCWSGKEVITAISGTRVSVEKTIPSGTLLFRGSITDGSATGSKTSLTKQSSTKSDYLIKNGYLNLELSPSITGAATDMTGVFAVDLIFETGNTIEY